MSTVAPESKPEAHIVHIPCKCGYSAAIEGFSKAYGKYVAMCLKCRVLTESDKPHEQRSSNGNQTE